MSISVTATNGTETTRLIEVSEAEIRAYIKRNPDAVGASIYCADAYGPDGLLVYPAPSEGWRISAPWRHISINPGPGSGRSANATGENPYDANYTE